MNGAESPDDEALPAIPPSAQLAGDILHGADAIAAFLYGDKSHRRKVYNLVETARLPVFGLGVNICARKSVLLAWIEAQERGQTVPAVASSTSDPAPLR